MNRYWWTGVAALSMIAPAAADDTSKENLRTITVTGTGEVKVKPDRALVRLGVTTFSSSLGEAKQDADGRMKRMLALIAKFKIEEKDCKTDYVNISPQYKREDYADRMDKFLGYQVTTGLAVTVRRLEMIDSFIAEAVEAGATHVHGVSFETSELRKHRDEARKLAIRAAREKALLLTGELGQRIGPARNINENPEGYWGYAQSNLSRGYGQGGGGGLFEDSDEGPDRTIVPGEISVKSTVAVVFDLE